METTINICYVISICSTLCILLGTTTYAFISYILRHAEHFSKQIDSIKENLRQGCKRGFEKGILLRDQLGRYVTNLTLLKDQMRQYMTNLVRPKGQCKDSKPNPLLSSFDLENYQVGLIPGQKALFVAIKGVVPRNLREHYRRMIFTLPTPTTRTIPTLEQVKGFLAVQVFLVSIKERNEAGKGTKKYFSYHFSRNDDWTETAHYKDVMSEYANPNHEGLSKWEIDSEVREEIKRKQEKYKNLTIPCQICRSQRHSARKCELYPFEPIAKECCSICLTEYKREFFHIRKYCMLESRRTALSLIFEEMEETGYSHGRETYKTQ